MSSEPFSTLNVIHEYGVAVAMRDGVILRGTLFRPSDTSRQYPVLVTRSPYGTSTEGYEHYARAGYIVYAQDVRGRYTSDGDFRVFSHEDHGEDRDGYDTVEWLAQQPWCNGQVGHFGSSYLGLNTWMTARTNPPHLVAINAETIPPELSDIDYPAGSFRPARRIHFWLTSMAPDLRKRLGLPPPHTTPEERNTWDEATFDRWLNLLPWAEIANHLPAPLARDVRDWFQSPGRPVWNFKETVYPKLTLPNLDVTGWYDHCLSLDHVRGMQQHAGSENARQHTKVIVGPWNHPGRGQRQLGDFDFGPHAEVDLRDTRLRWFDHWIKGIDNDVESWPAVQYFEMGSNQWRATNSWPPASKPQPWFLAGSAETANGTLHLQLDEKSAIEDHFDYDPRDPLPTLWPRTLITEVTDRAKLNHRADLLRYRSEKLTAAFTIAGDPTAVLFAASSALDTDFFVWLADEAPDGTAMEISSGMIRARHRHGLDHSELLTSGNPVELHVKLRPTAHCFLPGHRLRIEISSSDFPNFDRNHNTGGDDLHETAMQVAHQTVLHSGKYPTRVTLPLVEPR